MAVLLSEEPRVEPETVLPPVFGKETTHLRSSARESFPVQKRLKSIGIL
jgi:hypothetical protein